MAIRGLGIMVTIWLLLQTGYAAEVAFPKDGSFPERMPMNYGAVLVDSLQSTPQETEREKVESHSIGMIDGAPVELEYFIEGPDSPVLGVLQYQGNSYVLGAIGYAHDMGSIEVFSLASSLRETDKVSLLGGVGSPAARYQYILYDGSTKAWSRFQHGGIPRAFDIDQDGTDEVILQFQGRGVNLPDLSLLRQSQDGGFEIAHVNLSWLEQTASQAGNHRIASTLQLNGNEPQIRIELYGEKVQVGLYTLAFKDALYRITSK